MVIQSVQVFGTVMLPSPGGHSSLGDQSLWWRTIYLWVFQLPHWGNGALVPLPLLFSSFLSSLFASYTFWSAWNFAPPQVSFPTQWYKLEASWAPFSAESWRTAEYQTVFWRSAGIISLTQSHENRFAAYRVESWLWSLLCLSTVELCLQQPTLLLGH